MYRRLLERSNSGSRIDQRFLEYIKPDHPLLTTLQQSMPGTYRHSILVGSMAASAGQKIGVNADLIRCIAYYHDVGKITRPELYTEGQSGDRTKLGAITTRDELAAILFHPRGSQFILSDNDFPAEVLIAVAEHHGDIMTRLRIDEKLKKKLTLNELYYPGPRPSSKESAIVMLADSAEAVLNRTRLSQGWPTDPTREFIKAIVHRVGGELRHAGQFKDAEFSRFEQWSVEESLMWWMYRYYHGLDVVSTPYPQSK
jgi:putative nucleotidyltransferase with HDIG domain